MGGCSGEGGQRICRRSPRRQEEGQEGEGGSVMAETRSGTRREGVDMKKEEEHGVGQNIIRGLWGACDRFYNNFPTLSILFFHPLL